MKLKKKKWLICSKKKESSEALLKEGMSMLDEAMNMKDKGGAMTKAEAVNAIIQNARKALDDVQAAISNRDSQRKKKKEDINLPGCFPNLQLPLLNFVSFWQR